ncbi:hypothetical protein ACWD5Z_04350 [Micromonospora chokoriensis]
MDTFRLQLTETVQDLSFQAVARPGPRRKPDHPQAIRDLRGQPGGPDPVAIVRRFLWFLPLTDEEARAVALRLRLGLRVQPCRASCSKRAGYRYGGRMTLPFDRALRGYDMRQVESLFAEVDRALATDSAASRAAARDVLRAASLERRLRGYEMRQVDAAIDQRLADLAL